MESRRPVPGDFYRHFKDKLYQIIAVAKHSETGEEMVVYQALYGEFSIYVRPFTMFVSEVDHDKYPDVKQKYRFELVTVQKEKMDEIPVEAITEHPEVTTENLVLDDQPQNIQEKSDHYDGNTDYLVVNRDLIRFLEADTYEEKLALFTGMEKRINLKLLNDIAATLDIVLEGDSVEEGYLAIKNCLETWERFECNRFR